MVYTITSEEGYKKENTILCDKSTDNNKLMVTILQFVMIPSNLTGLKVSVEKYFKKKPEISRPAADSLLFNFKLIKNFFKFLSLNKQRSLFTDIILNNRLSLLSLFRYFSTKPSHAQFEQKIGEEANICGFLLQDFTNSLIEFLASTPGKVNLLLVKLSLLEDFITRSDDQKSKSLLAEVSGEVLEFAGKVCSTENLQSGGAKSLQEDEERRLEEARRENQVLSERNNNLREEAASVTASQETINNKMKILCEAVNNFSHDTKFHSIVAELNSNQDLVDNEELKALLEGLKKLQLSSSHCKQKRSEQGNLAVNLVLSDGEAVRFTTNKFNNISITELERFLSKKVKSVSAPQLMGGGYREMKILNGYVNCPTLGWGDGQYKVVTEAIPGKYQPRRHQPSCNLLVNISVHLGQGYSSSRPGQRLGGVWGPRSMK